MLAVLLKLGVLNPAGASVAEFPAIPTSPVPNAVSVANRQEPRGTFLRGGMSMSVPPKDTSRLRACETRLADRLTSRSQKLYRRGREVRSPIGVQTGLRENYSHRVEKMFRHRLLARERH